MALRASKKALENNITLFNEAEMRKAYIKDMTQGKKEPKPSKEELLLKAQCEKYMEYINKKIETWSSDFLLAMQNKLQTGETLSPNMEAALDKMMARDAEYEAKKANAEGDNKTEEPTRKITCKMRQWWIKEHKLESRVISGVIMAESAKAYLVKGHADMIDGTYCMRCGRELTEPASMVVGFGSECCEKLGIPYPSDILTASKKERMAIRKQLLKVLHNQEFEAWVPKSQIAELIEIADIEPAKKSTRAKASKAKAQ